MSNTAGKPDQKRQQGRLKVAMDGQYRFEGTDDWSTCTLFDISPNGIALGGKQSFYEGDKIEVQFVLEKRTVVVHLVITNLTGRKAGGKVTQISDADRLFVQEIFNREVLSGRSRLS